MIGFKKKINKKHLLSAFIIFSACLGISIENAAGIATTLHLSSHIHILVITLSLALIISGLLGLCSGFVNVLMNIDLVTSFIQRLFPNKTKKTEANQSADTQPWSIGKIYKHLPSARSKALFVFAFIPFLLTATLFIVSAYAMVQGAPAFAFFLSFASGALIAIMTMMQELDSCIEIFEELANENFQKENQIYEEETNSTQEKNTFLSYLSKPAGLLCAIIAIGNVLAFITMFTFGLSFLSIPSLSVALACIGGCCETFFYLKYLTKAGACYQKDILPVLQKNFKNHPVKTAICSTCIPVNAIVNAILFHISSQEALPIIIHSIFPHLYTAASTINYLSIALTIFGGLASFLIGLRFFANEESFFYQKCFATANNSSNSTSSDALQVKNTSTTSQAFTDNTDNSVTVENCISPPY